MSHPYSCVLFDLDGTIADSAPGITATLAYTFEKLGLPIPTPSELLVYVGPPILDSFRDLAHLSPEVSAQALAVYRERYLAHGVTDAVLYPGMDRVLRRLHAEGIPMSLATSKPELPATLILDEFDVTKYFDVITGASEDEVRSAKADVVKEALTRLRAIGADTSRPVMIGDRNFDTIGAAVNNVPTIFVEWGYGSPAERVGSVASAKDADELEALLFG